MADVIITGDIVTTSGSGQTTPAVSITTSVELGPTVQGQITAGATGPTGPQGPAGQDGAQGPQGNPGAGIAAGGTTGQVLSKNSNTDYDTTWSTLTKSAVGLGNVDNTSDLNKPISTATQTALDLKANDANVVHDTGNETVAGNKTFTGNTLHSASSGDALTIEGTGSNNTILRLKDDGTERGALYALNGSTTLVLRSQAATHFIVNNGSTPVTYGLTGSGLDMASKAIASVANPTNAQDAATKAYVDSKTPGTWLTWVPTQTGFSAAPTGGIYQYRYVNDEVEIMVRQPNDGTSNATTFTISLPVQAATVTDMVWQSMCRVRNNSNFVANPGYASISSGATVVELFINTGTTTWGTANGKRVDFLRMTYKY